MSDERLPYPTDLTDAQWSIIESLVPGLKAGGRPFKYERREIVNGILYIARSGCAWRLLPHDLPHWKDVYHYSGGS
jgi:putative transposase